MKPIAELPTVPGFYWWQEEPGEEFRLVELYDFGSGYLSAEDLETGGFSGRALSYWADHFPVGKWAGPLARPEAD